MNKRNILNISSLLSYIIFFIICERILSCAGTGIIVCSILIYSMLFIILMGSVMTTLSRMVMVRIHKGFFDSAKRVFGYCLVYTLFAGLFGFALLSLFAGKIGRIFLGDSSVTMILTFLGLFFLIDSFVRTIKGYYLGCEQSFMYVISIIVKNVVLIVACPFLVKYFSGIGAKAANLHKNEFLQIVYGSLGAVATMCVADLLMLLILIAGLRVVLHTDSFSFNEVRAKDGLSSFLKSFITPAFRVLKNNIFPALTIFVAVCIYCRSSFSSGETNQTIYSNVGAFGVPALLIITFCFLFYKEFVEDYRKRIRLSFSKEAENGNAVFSMFNNLLKSAITISFPAAVTVILFAGKISEYLCGCNNVAAKTLVVWAGVIMLFYAIDLAFEKTLDAVKDETPALIGRIIGFVCALLLMIVSSRTGSKMTSVIIAFAIDNIVSTIVHGYFVFMRIGFNLSDIIAKLIKVTIALIPMIIIDLLLSTFVAKNGILLVVSIAIGYSIYLITVLVIRGVTQKEINGMTGSLMFYPLSLINSFIGSK